MIFFIFLFIMNIFDIKKIVADIDGSYSVIDITNTVKKTGLYVHIVEDVSILHNYYCNN